jgi:RNA polymerase sigma factor (sigma-70 family)
LSEEGRHFVSLLGAGEVGMGPLGPSSAEVRPCGIRSVECREMSESDLLERFITENDHEAFRALIERHGRMVLAVCRNVLGESHDVDDAFQTTFLILAQSAYTIKQRDSIGPWLRRVALRVARKVRAKAYDRRALDRRDRSFEPETVGDHDDFVLIPMLREEMGRLPDRYRLPLVLCYLEGKTNEEAALQLRCPVGTIKGRLSRARGRLRDRLSQRGAALFPAAGDSRC